MGNEMGKHPKEDTLTSDEWQIFAEDRKLFMIMRRMTTGMNINNHLGELKVGVGKRDGSEVVDLSQQEELPSDTLQKLY